MFKTCFFYHKTYIYLNMYMDDIKRKTPCTKIMYEVCLRQMSSKSYKSFFGGEYLEISIQTQLG